MISLAIIGPGKIARDAHLPAIASSASFSLIACVSDAAGLPGLPCFPTIAALMRSGLPVQAVSICTPPQARAALAHEAISAGLHVLLEKPPAATLAACAGIEAAGKAAGVTVFAAWHSRHAAKVAAAGAWLAARHIISGKVTWAEDVRTWHPGQTWLWQPGGLGVFDCGINALSILTAISPALLTIAAAEFEVPDNAHTPMRAHLELDAAGAPIAMELDFLRPGQPLWSMTFDTDDGTMELANGGTTLTLPEEVPVAGTQLEYDAVYARYAELIEAGASECDAAPLRLVSDAFLLARVNRIDAFEP